MSVLSKSEIIAAIDDYIKIIPPFLANIDASIINKRIDNKWSIAENAEHLIRSIQPINLSLSLPKLLFFPFGKIHITRSYDDVVQLYHNSLEKGGKAGLIYTPKPTFNKRSAPKIALAWKETHSITIKRIDSWSEQELDKYCLPHPLIGKLTMREMLFFTIYHVGHHFETMQQIKGNGAKK